MSKSIKMMNIILTSFFVLAAGCYAESRFNRDGGSDAAGDDGAAPDGGHDVGPDVAADPLPDSPCMELFTPRFEGLDYQDTVQAGAAFTMTIHHEGAMNATATYSLGQPTIEIVLAGVRCTCDPCPIGTPTVFEAVLYFNEGLPAGEYTILIQGQSFLLHVIGECQRNLLSPDAYSITCPEEIRISQAASLGFSSYGMGCGCGGYAETTTSFVPPTTPGSGRLDIGAVEVVCDPSQCCMECNCIDSYPVSLSVTYPQEGFYYNYVNENYLCFTAVFGDDGCSDWQAGYMSVIYYTAEVFYGNPVGFDFSLSTGFCCGGTPFVVEERPDTYRVNLTPLINVCEGSCCYMCDCIDSFPLHYDIYDLSAGPHQVCVEGAACYDVIVHGYD